MSTLESKSSSRFRRSFVPQSALAMSIEFTEEMMNVSLTDGRILSVPLVWFASLYHASPEQRLHYEIGAGGGGFVLVQCELEFGF